MNRGQIEIIDLTDDDIRTNIPEKKRNKIDVINLTDDDVAANGPKKKPAASATAEKARIRQRTSVYPAIKHRIVGITIDGRPRAIDIQIEEVTY
jgi:hypothetical protein